MIVLLDIHQCCAKGFYEARTTSRCLSSPFHYLSSFVAWMGVRRMVIFARPFGLCVETASACLLLWCICISKTLLIPFFKFLLDFDSISISSSQRWDVQKLHFLFGCICARNHGILEPCATQNIWYQYLCTRCGRHWWTLVLLGPFLVAMWSISCIDHHSFWQGNIAP